MYSLTALFVSATMHGFLLVPFHTPVMTRAECEYQAGKFSRTLQEIADDAGLKLGVNYLFEMRCDPKAPFRSI